MQVLIVDSSVQIIERMQQLLTEMEHISTVFGAVAYRDGSEFFRATDPSVVLIDSRLHDNECVRLIREIKMAAAGTQVIVMMNGEDNQMQEKYRSSGADILFDKYHDFERIPEAINLIAAKKREGNRYGF
jgi:DNA-binding NarL/FixJ family response regulator